MSWRHRWRTSTNHNRGCTKIRPCVPGRNGVIGCRSQSVLQPTPHPPVIAAAGVADHTKFNPSSGPISVNRFRSRWCDQVTKLLLASRLGNLFCSQFQVNKNAIANSRLACASYKKTNSMQRNVRPSEKDRFSSDIYSIYIGTTLRIGCFSLYRSIISWV